MGAEGTSTYGLRGINPQGVLPISAMCTVHVGLVRKASVWFILAHLTEVNYTVANLQAEIGISHSLGVKNVDRAHFTRNQSGHLSNRKSEA